jgi:hypothetical protein
MYLDKEDVQRIKDILNESDAFEEDLYLLYRRVEDSRMEVAHGEYEIQEALKDGSS